MDKQPLTYTILKWAFINFFIAAVLGVLLRSTMVVPLAAVHDKYWLHAHSHFAMAGWIFTALMGAVFHSFINTSDKFFRRLFYATLVACYGMLFSFPVRGYWWLSISFSTLYIIITYIFTYAVFKRTKAISHLVSVKLLRAALVFLCLSSLGAFALGPVMATGKTGSVLYFDAIYFYLHFQYNGWFIPAIAALLFRYLELKSIPFSKPLGDSFYRLLTVSIVPLYFLSTLWSNPGPVFNILSAMGAVMQVLALIVLIVLLKELQKSVKTSLLVSFILLLVSHKVILQLPGSFQPLAELAYSYRNFVIAFLHLIMLGIVSLSIIVWLKSQDIFMLRGVFPAGLLIFIMGFISSELLMVIQPLLAINGAYFKDSNVYILISSLLLPAGVSLMAVSIRNSIRE